MQPFLLKNINSDSKLIRLKIYCRWLCTSKNIFDPSLSIRPDIELYSNSGYKKIVSVCFRIFPPHLIL